MASRRKKGITLLRAMVAYGWIRYPLAGSMLGGIGLFFDSFGVPYNVMCGLAVGMVLLLSACVVLVGICDFEWWKICWFFMSAALTAFVYAGYLEHVSREQSVWPMVEGKITDVERRQIAEEGERVRWRE